VDQTPDEGRAHFDGKHGLFVRGLPLKIVGVAIRVRILGAAAGGGLPQWNCVCRNCHAARTGLIQAQTQSSVAVSSDGRRWFLINASPDLRAQFGAFPPLHPGSISTRNNPLEAVLLTNADLDHTLGLLLLREGEPLHLHASKAVREHLSRDLAFVPLLTAFCGVVWHEPPVEQWAPLCCADGQPSGLACRAVPLRSPPPVFSAAGFPVEEQAMAFLLRDERTGGALLVAPDVFEITQGLEDALQSVDAVLFDGTFWSEDELGVVKASARKASAMGHLPIKNGSMAILSRSPARHRIYLHINNTNPILFPGSAERRAVENAGIVIGCDGMEFEI
jgi:pyrroloquinoline quinone biosynthesis protein B